MSDTPKSDPVTSGAANADMPAQPVAPPKAPAPGTATKAAPATPTAKPLGPTVVGDRAAPVNKMRRRVVWSCVWGFTLANLLMILRFFLPRTIFEPSEVFRIGYPSEYGLGVDTKWQQQYRIWVVRDATRLYVIRAICTHLGCTPDWIASENKFKCPCHGSGYTPDGVNFEGPAPRPMDRAHVELDPTGQVLVNVGKLYRQVKGEETEFNKEGAFIQV